MREFHRAGGYGDTPTVGLGIDELRWQRPARAGDALSVTREGGRSAHLVLQPVPGHRPHTRDGAQPGWRDGDDTAVFGAHSAAQSVTEDGDDAQCLVLAETARQRWGGVDTLVNRAGITTRFADIRDLHAIGAEDFEAIYRVNVIGVFQMSRAIAPLMQSRDGASIVNISSMAGRMGTGSSIAYAASKGALNMLTLSLARSLALALVLAVRVNAILSGMVDGDWLRNGLGGRFSNSAGSATRPARCSTR